MNTTEVLAALQERQVAFIMLMALELTGYLFPPPAVLRDGNSFDFIIVGGGTSGSVIATRLAQQNYNVLLIEAGDDAPYETTIPGLVNYPKNSWNDWNYTTYNDGSNYQCQRDHVMDLGIGKQLGGSSELNYMVYSRGHFSNFDEWAKITNDSTWSWKGVLPYFKKSENVSDVPNLLLSNLYGTRGYIGITKDMEPDTDDFLEAFKEAGKDIIYDIDGSKLGYSGGLFTIKNGFRQGAGTSYLSKISESSYIANAKNTLVTRILINKLNVAEGVELITDEGIKIIVYARKEIIVTAGAIKTPQLLMLSGIGPEEQLKKHNIEVISNLPVGKNLQDHIAAFIPYKLKKSVITNARNPGKYISGLFVGYASLNKDKNQLARPDYNVIGETMLTTSDLLQFCASRYKFPKKICNNIADEAGGNQVLAILLANLHALSRGQVLLQSTEPMDAPKVLADGFSYDKDLDALVDYIYDYLKVEQTDVFKNIVEKRIDMTSSKCKVFENDSRDYWRCHILCSMVSLRSFAGTCAMGSVVDSRLRVKGVTGLRVADASIMPTKVSGVTHNTVVMIGEKASDMIIDDAGLYNFVEHEQIRRDQVKNSPRYI